MSQVTITLPGEATVVAIANMITALAEGQSPETKKILWERYVILTEPWFNLAVEFNKHVAALVARSLDIPNGPTQNPTR